jgi:hypothetical protein
MRLRTVRRRFYEVRNGSLAVIWASNDLVRFTSQSRPGKSLGAWLLRANNGLSRVRALLAARAGDWM